ncbi:hypothetical protein [Kitasatospora sp. NPDC059327]|uniref:hypothetical protein n=1 Tax=Kitasatospora sp. NPDC059327 TaxID=3346803 RepID=UPI00369E56E8
MNENGAATGSGEPVFEVIGERPGDPTLSGTLGIRVPEERVPVTEQQVRAALAALGIDVSDHVQRLARAYPQMRLAFLLSVLWCRVGSARDAAVENIDHIDARMLAGPAEMDATDADHLRRAHGEVSHAADRLLFVEYDDRDGTPPGSDPWLGGARAAAEAAASLLAPRVLASTALILTNRARTHLEAALEDLDRIETMARHT